jgi:heterodisulfide reductase subunit A
MNLSKSRIGVFVCRCGENISRTVDVPKVVQRAERLDLVVLAKEFDFMCSDSGQNMIREEIFEHELNRVVVASCSPLMHEVTFQEVCESAGMNPFFLQMTNIREQCAWVIDDKDEATEKAESMVAGAVRRVRYNHPLQSRPIKMEPSVLVVGAGIAGIEAALKVADAGKQVYLVEREPSIGGHLGQLYKTFPTLDCAA